MLSYHTTVTSALQTVARLARASPMVAVITAPVEKAEQIARRQVERYPTISADHVTRTHLRKAKLPAVQLVVMPPKKSEVVMLLLSNVIPPNSREVWRDALSEDDPLQWRNYQLIRGKNKAITWRLSEQARQHYRKRLARLITGRGGIPGKGETPYMLPHQTARDQVLQMAAHMQHYPGLSGVRADVFDLAQHSTKLWRSTRPDEPYPAWPTMPYARFNQPQTAPLSELKNHQQEEPDYDEETDEGSNQ